MELLLVIVFFLIIVVVLSLLMLGGLVLRVEVAGTSMRPNLDPGDTVLARRVPLSRIRTGDVVVIEGRPMTSEQVRTMASRWVNPAQIVETRQIPASTGPVRRQLMIKRVAAVPGDPVPSVIPVSNDDTVVPNGSVFVLGDNLENSIDSRVFGYVSAERIIAKVILRLSAGGTEN